MASNLVSDLCPASDGFQSIRVSSSGGVSTITLLPDDGLDSLEAGAVPIAFAQHKEIATALDRLSADPSIRVIVLTGVDGTFVAPSKRSVTLKDLSPEEDWGLIEGLRRTLLAILQHPCPIIAKVNGNAVGYGSSLMFACDFIIASEDALIADHHLGMGELPYGKPDFGFVPGDGGTVFVPFAMSHAETRDYLTVARHWTPREMAARCMINDAVAPGELNAAVDRMCAALKRRPYHALAWTKRILNQPVIERFVSGYDAAMAFEVINILHRRSENARAG